MEFVALLSFRPGADRDAALIRRASYQFPEGIRPIAEYWPVSSSVQVVLVFAADSWAPVMELELEWTDAFDINVSPAVSAEEGLKVGTEVYGRLRRLKQ